MRIIKPYLNRRAVAYARRWALSRNPLFVDFTGQGGNCTNFVSQCVLAGSCVMDLTPTFGWYYISSTDRAPAWTSVDYFHDFMTGAEAFSSQNRGVGPFAVLVPRRLAVPGDVIQLCDEEGDWYHSLIISALDRGEIYVCAQSDDALDRPLSSYQYAKARFLHFQGVHIATSDELQYDCLLNGLAAPAGEAVMVLPETPETAAVSTDLRSVTGGVPETAALVSSAMPAALTARIEAVLAQRRSDTDAGQEEHGGADSATDRPDVILGS